MVQGDEARDQVIEWKLDYLWSRSDGPIDVIK
jgi:hypothetical protein